MTIYDLRYRRTEKLIIDAFLNLLSQKDFKDINVKDIVEKAMINRSTFYGHYADKIELYNHLIDKLLDQMEALMDASGVTTKHSIEVKRVEKLLTNLYKTIKSNHHISKLLVGSSLNDSIKEKFETMLRRKYDYIFEQVNVTNDGNPIPIDFIITYLSSTFYSVLSWWIKSEYEMPPKQLAQLLIKLISNGHLTVMGIDINRQ